MRKRIIIANWKMYLSVKESFRLACRLQEELKTMPDKIEVVICPSFPAIPTLGLFLTNIEIGAQDCCWEENGAFTGEVSASSLKEMGCKYVIIGHSERRVHNLETNEMVNKKIKAALKNSLTPILCVGETQKQRDENLTDYVVIEQLREGLKDIQLTGNQQLIIAYEPIWAIGSGRPVSGDEPERVHRIIRHSLLDYLPSDVVKNRVRTIYGGSVNADNVMSFTNQGAEDGVLVGSASVKIDQFIQIVKKVSI